MAGNEILLTCLVAWATDKLPINSNYDMLIHSKIRTTNDHFKKIQLGNGITVLANCHRNNNKTENWFGGLDDIIDRWTPNKHRGRQETTRINTRKPEKSRRPKSVTAILHHDLET